MGMDLESGDLDANGSVWIACVKASLNWWSCLGI